MSVDVGENNSRVRLSWSNKDPWGFEAPPAAQKKKTALVAEGRFSADPGFVLAVSSPPAAVPGGRAIATHGPDSSSRLQLSGVPEGADLQVSAQAYITESLPLTQR